MCYNELHIESQTAGLADARFSPRVDFTRWHHPPKQVLQMALCQNTLTVSTLARQSMPDPVMGIARRVGSDGEDARTSS
jgi:hypothetical protein